MKANAKLVRLGAAAVMLGTLYFLLARPGEAEPPPARAEPDYFAFVRSMEGTRPDGDVKVGAGDRLVVDAELGHLFDYYLAGLGETGLAAIRAEIEKELDRRLKPAPAAQAKRLLASYLAYKRELVDIERGLPRGAGLVQAARSRKYAMEALRLKHFSADEIKGLFGFADAYDGDALARIEIMEDKGLSVEQRRQRLAALDAKLQPALREEREAPARIVKLEESVQQKRAEGASEDDIYRMRAAALTPEAAARLADVDRDEAAWKDRIGAYLAQRAALPADAAEAQRQQLRDAAFTPEEQRRLAAYE